MTLHCYSCQLKPLGMPAELKGGHGQQGNTNDTMRCVMRYAGCDKIS